MTETKIDLYKGQEIVIDLFDTIALAYMTMEHVEPVLRFNAPPDENAILRSFSLVSTLLENVPWDIMDDHPKLKWFYRDLCVMALPDEEHDGQLQWTRWMENADFPILTPDDKYAGPTQ